MSEAMEGPLTIHTEATRPGFADPRRGIHSPGFGSYQDDGVERVTSRAGRSRHIVAPLVLCQNWQEEVP